MKKSTILGLLFVLPVMMLSTSAHAFDINGTYTSENGDFVLTITNSYDGNGSFSGTYVTNYTPRRSQKVSEDLYRRTAGSLR